MYNVLIFAIIIAEPTDRLEVVTSGCAIDMEVKTEHPIAIDVLGFTYQVTDLELYFSPHMGCMVMHIY